jgi:type I restriction enzyme S subunit
MSDLKEYKLGDIANTSDFVANGSFASLKENVKYLNTEDYAILIRLYDFHNKWKGPFVHVDIDSYKFLKKSYVEPGDLIIANVGANAGESFLAPSLDKKMTLGPNSILIKGENCKYLFYYFNSGFGKWQLDSIITGSAQPKFNKTDLRNLIVKLPSLSKQKSISEILSSLDAKIELNNKINEELESLAQLFFKQWIVDFDFPNENGEPYKSSGGEMIGFELGEIPKGWKVKKLKQILNIKRGGSPRPIHDYMASSGLPWVKISDATALNSPFLFSTKEFIKVEGLKKTILIKKGSLILSNSATPGLPIFLELDACIHDGWLHFQDIQDVTYNFLYLLFLYIRKDLVGQGNGSIFINLKTDILKEYSITIPHKEVLEKFNDSINSIFNTIKTNSSENIELIKLRDTLLPKLISGELQINDN